MDLEQILILGFVVLSTVLSSAIIINKLKGNSTSNTMKRRNKEAITDHYETLISINEDQKLTINQLRGKCTQFAKKIAELEGMPQEEDTKPLAVSPQLLNMAASALKMNPQAIEAMLQSEQAQKFLKNKSNQKLIESILPFITAKLGNGQEPQSPTSVQEA